MKLEPLGPMENKRSRWTGKEEEEEKEAPETQTREGCGE